ncbi:MAG: Uma2 family endonuclease [Hyphomonadaceae bacterium]|nr:Uma2 family endonuclease [Hyphomonadaceae bacterium]
MADTIQRTWTLEDFLAWESSQAGRHEFVAGQVRAMTGATKAHNLIAANIYSALRAGLRGTPCQPFIGDIKIIIQANGNVRYPDVLVDCSPFVANDVAAKKPTIVFEVLSKSTAWIDQTDKMDDYASVDSIAVVFLVRQSARAIEVWRRDGARLVKAPDAGEVIALDPLAMTISLDAIYDGVPLSADEDRAEGA